MISSTEFKTIIDVVLAFPNEKACHQYLASRRWDDGVMACPYEGCEGDTAYIFADGIRYKCKCCKRVYTAKTGTFMEASKLATIKWFMALYLVLHKKGISSVQLSKDVGVTQKTAWFMLQRIRLALGMDTADEKLSGIVEIDETFVGGKNKNRHYDKKLKYKEDIGRTWPDKVPVFGMVSRSGRVKAEVIDSRHFADIGLSVVKNIEFHSTLHTDDWKGYDKLSFAYERKSVDHSKGNYANGYVTTNRVENFWSHLKRGLHGTYISVSPKHLNRYVQEFVFRRNYMNEGVQKQFDCIIANMDCRLKYKDLVA